MVLEKRQWVKYGGRVELADWTALAGTGGQWVQAGPGAGGQWVQAGAFLSSPTLSPLLCYACKCTWLLLLSSPLLLVLLYSAVVSATGFNSSSAWWRVGTSRCFSTSLPSPCLQSALKISQIVKMPLKSRTSCITFKFQHQMNKIMVHCQ